MNYQKILYSLSCTVLLSLSGIPAAASKNNAAFEALLAMSLEELSNVPVKTVSRKQLPLRESPGIVTIITAEEITNSGARDLIDVLRLVPGISFGVDVASIIGVGMRGSWAHEGKVLLLIDGIELNERSYGTTQFGAHYPVEHIKRIEVVRGPGSVMHGGFAGLGVINIITYAGEDLKGGRFSAKHGQTAGTYGRMHLNMAWGQGDSAQGGKGLFSVGQAQRSNRDYVDFNGRSLEMDDTGRLNSRFILLGGHYQGLRLRFLQDRYQVENRDAFGRVFTSKLRNDFNTEALLLDYDHDLSEQLSLSSSLGYSHQSAWERRLNGRIRNKVITDRWQARLALNYTVNADLNFTMGGEFTRDSNEDRYFKRQLPDYKNITSFLEGQYKSALGIVTMGLRYDDHDTFGSRLLPRLGLTKAFNDWHFKVLYSESFRVPTVENYHFNKAIQPETTKVYELEAGYRFNPKLQVTANIFRINSRNAILYGVVPGTNEEGYFNAEDFSTGGFEAELRYRDDWGYATFNHSYYRVAKNTLDSFQIINFQDESREGKLTLGFPAHKSTLNMHFKLTPAFSINPSVVFLSSRYAYTTQDEENRPVLQKFSPAWLTNIYFRYEGLMEKRLSIGLGVYDLFGENLDFIQPYNGGHAPLPGPSREVMLKAEYRF